MNEFWNNILNENLVKIHIYPDLTETCSYTILQYLLKNSALINVNGKAFYHIEITIESLYKMLYPEYSDYDNNTYELIKNQLDQMLNSSLMIEDSTGVCESMKITDFIKISQKSNEKECKKLSEMNYEIDFGRSFSAFVIFYKMLLHSDEKYSVQLGATVSVLYWKLLRNRLMDLCLFNRAEREYSFISMCLLYRLSVPNQFREMEKYKELLTEMKNMGFCIKDFYISNNQFFLRWIPLTKKEQHCFDCVMNGECGDEKS